MATHRMVNVKGTNVRVGDYRNGYVVDSIIVLGHGPFGAIIELYSADGKRETIYGDDTYRVERTYA